MKPKVLFVIDTLEIGGAERSLSEILGAMREFEPIICQLYPGDALAEVYREAGVRRIALELPGKYNFRRAIGALRKVIDTEKPALVVSTLFRADIVARVAARLAGTPVVSSFVNDTYSAIRMGEMSLQARAKHTALRMLDAATARFAAHFVSNSHAIARSNARALGISTDDITVIYRARDATRFAGQRVRELPSDGRVVILNVARLQDRKRQIDIIEAMPRVLEHYPHAVLRIAGEGSYRGELERRVAQLGLGDAVQLLGSRDDIPDQLKDAHVFVSASQYEGLPGSVIEAMLAGVPMTLSDMDVHREMDTQAAPIPYFALHRPDSIADRILEILGRYASQVDVAQARRDWARTTFDLQTVVSQHEALYRSVASKARSL